MSRPLDPIVPEPLKRLLEVDPGDPIVDGFTLLLLTTRGDGWPHQAMLSVGEVAPVADNRLKLAVWPGSTSTANLRERGQATLTAVVDGVAYALFLTAEPAADVGTLVCFDARVAKATADEAPYARLDSGIRFTLNDREPTIERWRTIRSELAE